MYVFCGEIRFFFKVISLAPLICQPSVSKALFIYCICLAITYRGIFSKNPTPPFFHFQSNPKSLDPS